MIKIFTSAQIKEADRYTILHEPVSSLDLMERASAEIARWVASKYAANHHFYVFAGKGNNGGDGLAVARLLFLKGYRVSVATLFDDPELSPETLENYKRLPSEIPVYKTGAASGRERPAFDFSLLSGNDAVVIDAILGTGVRGDVTKDTAQVIRRINDDAVEVVSIDLPSGMQTEFGNRDKLMVHATVTLTLEFPKLALFLPEAGNFAGEVIVLPIGLSECYKESTQTPYFLLTESSVRALLVPRSKFSHKGTFGSALLICGKTGMMGAAVLACKGALKGGCGLVYAHVPYEERHIIQASVPQVIVGFDSGHCFSEVNFDPGSYSAIGIGCGLGQDEKSRKALKELLSKTEKPLVIDADAVNMIAGDKQLLQSIPKNSVLTPHPKEFERLAGKWEDEAAKFDRLGSFCRTHEVIVVLKGAYTVVCSPGGNMYFNPTGNAGMAKGGSGDVLTGLIASLTARGYDPLTASLIGVWHHGRAGDRTAEKYGMESMTVLQLIEEINIG